MWARRPRARRSASSRRTKRRSTSTRFEGIATDRTRVRPIHVASGIGQVDVLNVPAHGIATILWDDLDFGVAADAIDLPAGPYAVGLDLNGDRVPEALFRIPALPGGTAANLFAVAEPDAVYLLAETSDGATIRIDASH